MTAALQLLSEVVLRKIPDPSQNSNEHFAITYLLEKISRYSAQVLFRPDHIEEMVLDCFSNETARDFIFNAQYEFYATAGDGPGFIEALCNTLEDALLIDGPCADVNILPEAIKDSTPLAFYPRSHAPIGFFATVKKMFSWNQPVSLTQFLQNNPFIVTVLLLKFITVEQATFSKS